LLCRRGDPFTIVDCYLPKQLVSGCKCAVDAHDVVAVGRRIARDGLAVAGSLHRHPSGKPSLSNTDAGLLQGMAAELASELVVPVRVTRKPRELVLRVHNTDAVRSQSGRRLEPDTYIATDVETEEIVLGARVYCLVWSPTGGYGGAAANVLYDTVTGEPRREFRYLPEIIVERPTGDLPLDCRMIMHQARQSVREMPRIPACGAAGSDHDGHEVHCS
jgi:hypothetical protein